MLDWLKLLGVVAFIASALILAWWLSASINPPVFYHPSFRI